MHVFVASFAFPCLSRLAFMLVFSCFLVCWFVGSLYACVRGIFCISVSVSPCLHARVQLLSCLLVCWKSVCMCSWHLLHFRVCLALPSCSCSVAFLFAGLLEVCMHVFVASFAFPCLSRLAFMLVFSCFL